MAQLTSSIRAKLLASFFLLTAALLAVGGYYQTQSDVGNSVKDEVENLNRLARFSARHIARTIAHTSAVVTSIALDSEVSNYLSQAEPKPSERVLRALGHALELSKDKQGAPLFVDFYLVDEDGKIRFTSNDSTLIGKTVSDRPYFTHAVAGNPYVSNILAGRTHELQHRLYFSSPVFSSSEPHTVTGVAVMEVDGNVLENLTTEIREVDRPGSVEQPWDERRFVLVTDASGKIVSPWWWNRERANDQTAFAGRRPCEHPPKENAKSTVCVCRSLASRVSVHDDKLKPIRGEGLAELLASGATEAAFVSEDEAHHRQGFFSWSSYGWHADSERVLVGISRVNDFLPAGLSLGASRDDSAAGWTVIFAEDAAAFEHHEQSRVARATFLVALFALLGTCIVMYLVLRRLVRELGLLVAGAKAIGDGDLAMQLQVNSDDELGRLAAAFNAMAAKLKTTMSELKAARDEAARESQSAKEANEAQARFVQNMSHELRTPLNAVIGYSEMLIEDATDPQTREDLQRIRSSGADLLQKVNAILDYAKLANDKTVVIESFEVAPMLEEIASETKPLIAKNGNEFRSECAADIRTVRADRKKLRDSILNLVANAAKFTRNGRVELSVERRSTPSGARLLFGVRDTGIGISQEQIARLFKPFAQADESTTRKYGGTGLGLSIALQSIELMGGTISVESTPGQGSAFTIDLPAEPVTEGAPDSSTSRRRDVLVIDDDLPTRQSIRDALNAAGFLVRGAATSEEGLKAAIEAPPAAILLDVAMPKVDGWSVIDRLKSIPTLRNVPLIMMTVVGEAERSIAFGAIDYLSKPVDADLLCNLLKKYIAPPVDGHVLVVDDDLVTRQMLRRTLERAGFAVEDAENGRIAVESVHRERPALILLDLMMPEMSGFEVIARLQSDEQLRSIPVVVMTAKDLTAEDRKMLQDGVHKVYQKGAFNRDDLLVDVADLVGTLKRRIRASSAPKD